MKTNYTITRDKFMEFKERDWLVKVCKVEAENDLMEGRITWPARYMLETDKGSSLLMA